MKKLLDSLKDEAKKHRDRMTELVQVPFFLGSRPVYVVVCPERHIVSAWIGSLHLSSHSCNKAGAAKLASAIITECGVRWMDYGPELLSLINIAMRTP